MTVTCAHAGIGIASSTMAPKENSTYAKILVRISDFFFFSCGTAGTKVAAKLRLQYEKVKQKGGERNRPFPASCPCRCGGRSLMGAYGD